VVSEELARLVSDLKSLRGLKLGKARRCVKDTSLVVIPIIREVVGERRYRVLEEVRKGVSIRDVGSVEGLSVSSKVEFPVLIRGGVMLRGGTQPRAVKYSVVVEPLKKLRLRVACIHAIMPVYVGASLKADLDVPERIHRARLARRDQWEVWRMVDEYARERLSSEEIAEHGGSPDLSRTVKARVKSVRDVARKFPRVEGQVGFALVGPDGVYAVEVYDHPDSWAAVSKKVALKYAELVLEKKGERPTRRKALRELHKFLDEVLKCFEEEVHRGARSYTRLLDSDDLHGEYTVLDGEIIHFLAFKAEDWIEELERGE